MIGMLLAMVVLIGFGLLFLFAFDEGLQGGEQSIESVIAHQSKEIESTQIGIEQGKLKLAHGPALTALAKDLSGTKRTNIAALENIVSAKQAIELGKSQLEELGRNFEEYKDKYRAFVRGKAKGESIALLETRSGGVYKNAVIREVTPVGIQIRHDDGQKRLPFEDLPDAMVDYYQFDPRQKSDALAAEAVIRNEHEAQAAVANTLADGVMAEQRKREQEERREKVRRGIETRQAQIEGLRQEVESLNNEMDRAASAADSARAAGRMHINKSGSINGSIRSKQNRIAAIQAEISQMESSLGN